MRFGQPASAERSRDTKGLAREIYLTAREESRTNDVHLFWPSQFASSHDVHDVLAAVHELDDCGFVRLFFGFECTNCKRQWRGTRDEFTGLNNRCPVCRADLREAEVRYQATFELVDDEKKKTDDTSSLSFVRDAKPTHFTLVVEGDVILMGDGAMLAKDNSEISGNSTRQLGGRMADQQKRDLSIKSTKQSKVNDNTSEGVTAELHADDRSEIARNHLKKQMSPTTRNVIITIATAVTALAGAAGWYFRTRG